MLANKTPSSNISIVLNISDELNKKLYESVVQLVEYPKDKKGTLLPTPGRRINVNPRGKYKTKMATYKQIKDYIKEKFGLNVHSSYIAEIKRIYGVKMQSYRQKEEAKRVVHPTPKMAAAIKDALIHFRIIE